MTQAPGLRGLSVCGPSLNRSGEGVLQRVLRAFDISRDANQTSENAAVLFSIESFDQHLACSESSSLQSPANARLRQPRPDRSNLYRAIRHRRNLFGPGNRGVEIRGFD